MMTVTSWPTTGSRAVAGARTTSVALRRKRAGALVRCRRPSRTMSGSFGDSAQRLEETISGIRFRRVTSEEPSGPEPILAKYRRAATDRAIC